MTFCKIISPQVCMYGQMHRGKQLAKDVGGFSTTFSHISRLHSTLSMSQSLSPCNSVLVEVFFFFFLLGAFRMESVGTVQNEGAISIFLVDFSIIVIIVNVKIIRGRRCKSQLTPVKPSLSAGNPDDVTFQESYVIQNPLLSISLFPSTITSLFLDKLSKLSSQCLVPLVKKGC